MLRGQHAPFPRDEYVRRLDRVRAAMAERRLDGLLLTTRENVLYFSGLQARLWDAKPRPVALILPADSRRPVLVLAAVHAAAAAASCWIDDVRLWGDARDPAAARDPITAVRDALHDLRLASARMGMETGSGTRIGMPISDYEALRAALPEMVAADGGPAVWAVRMIKSPREIACIRCACDATSRAFARGFSGIRAGQTERELAGVFLQEMATTNYRPGFVTVRSGLLKYRMAGVEPFDTPLAPGDLVLVDAGAVHRDYWADFMRMACLGEPTADQRRFFACAQAAEHAGVQAVRPGAPLGSVAAACARVVEESGLSRHASMEWVGHGLGMDLDEPPAIARHNDMGMREGMVLTVEPAFYDLPDGRIGSFGVEDVVLVTATGREVLSSFPTDLWVA